DAQLAYLDLPFDYRGETDAEPGPKVKLSARFAGDHYTWPARIVRTEGAIDERSRMIHVVAQVDDPYGRSEDADRPPLVVGLFVDAEISGRHLSGVVTLPTSVLRDDVVWVVDQEDRLRSRRVELIRRERDRIVLSSGFVQGDRVVVSRLRSPIDGVFVRVEATTAQPEALTATELP
ncbi:MAG: efflux transporter periplasmic adaptor subunit, partial [Myxococcota bacterium]